MKSPIRESCLGIQAQHFEVLKFIKIQGQFLHFTDNIEIANLFIFLTLVSFPVMTSSGPRLTVLSKSLMGLSTANKVVGNVVTTTTNAGGRLGMRVPSLNVNASPIQVATAIQQQQPQQQQQSLRCGIVTRSAQKEPLKVQPKEEPKSEFHIVSISSNYSNLFQLAQAMTFKILVIERI